MKKVFFIILFLPVFLWAQAPFEDGYIITNAGDTVRGKIKDRKYTTDYANCEKINFMDGAGNESTKTPDDIKQYCKKGKLFFYTLPVGLENKPKFAQLIVSGEVLLFGYTNTSLSTTASDMSERIKEKVEKKNEKSKVDYFLQRKGNPNSLMKVRRKTFEETTTFFFQDNAELVQKIQTKAYQYTDIEQLVKLYNESKVVKK